MLRNLDFIFRVVYPLRAFKLGSGVIRLVAFCRNLMSSGNIG